ncbi:hypothetical protein ACFFWE_06235 [Sphaerisporangium melleum]|nr:hypothetical protein [Sphaerisporangium melleum]
MVARNPVRRMLALGSALVAIGAWSAVAAQPAAADAIVLNATVDCLNVNYSGDTRDWYPLSPSVYGPLSYAEMTAIPATHAWQFTRTLPAGTTSVSGIARCSEGHQYGDYTGSYGTLSIPAGATTVTATWSCSTAPVYPGPWLTNCTAQLVSYS